MGFDMLVFAIIDAMCTRRVEDLDHARSIENVIVCRRVNSDCSIGWHLLFIRKLNR
jgi:hypothetical protein